MALRCLWPGWWLIVHLCDRYRYSWVLMCFRIPCPVTGGFMWLCRSLQDRHAFGLASKPGTLRGLILESPLEISKCLTESGFESSKSSQFVLSISLSLSVSLFLFLSSSLPPALSPPSTTLCLLPAVSDESSQLFLPPLSSCYHASPLLRLMDS